MNIDDFTQWLHGYIETAIALEKSGRFDLSIDHLHVIRNQLNASRAGIKPIEKDFVWNSASERWEIKDKTHEVIISAPIDHYFEEEEITTTKAQKEK